MALYSNREFPGDAIRVMSITKRVGFRWFGICFLEPGDEEYNEIPKCVFRLVRELCQLLYLGTPTLEASWGVP